MVDRAALHVGSQEGTSGRPEAAPADATRTAVRTPDEAIPVCLQWWATVRVAAILNMPQESPEESDGLSLTRSTVTVNQRD